MLTKIPNINTLNAVKVLTAKFEVLNAYITKKKKLKIYHISQLEKLKKSKSHQRKFKEINFKREEINEIEINNRNKVSKD